MYRSLLLAAIAATRATSQSLQSVLEGQSDTLSVFTQYVQDTGLLDDLAELEPVTIFAPTNDAFSAALEAYPDLVTGNGNSTSDNDDGDATFSSRFLDILRYHVVPGVALGVADIVPYPGDFYATALNGIVVNPYTDEDGGAMVFSAEKMISEVGAAGIEFDNGVIHTLDSVLLPPPGAPTTALDMGFQYFYGAVQQTDLAEVLNTTSQLTVFIPTDQAFIDVGGALADLSADELTSLVQFHAVVGQTLYTTNLTDGDTLNTAANTPYDNGLDITVDEDDGALYVSNARVITPNILLRNGVAHLIDQVLNVQEDDDAYGFVYDLNDGDGSGVPGFEDAASATVPALTSGLPSATNSFSPTATFSAVSGASEKGASSSLTVMGLVYAALLAMA